MSPLSLPSPEPYQKSFTAANLAKDQAAIAEYLDAKEKEVLSMSATIESQISSLTTYRKSLIHECVTGQRRISEEDLRRAGHAGCIRPVEHRP